MLQKRNSVIAANTIILAIILLAGVIMMIYGYIHNNSLIIYFGVFITGAASFIMTMFQTIFSQKNKRRILHDRELKDIKSKNIFS